MRSPPVCAARPYLDKHRISVVASPAPSFPSWQTHTMTRPLLHGGPAKSIRTSRGRGARAGTLAEFFPSSFSVLRSSEIRSREAAERDEKGPGAWVIRTYTVRSIHAGVARPRNKSKYASSAPFVKHRCSPLMRFFLSLFSGASAGG